MPRTNTKSAALPTDFDSLVRLHPPAAIHDEVAYENTMEIINRLTAISGGEKA